MQIPFNIFNAKIYKKKKKSFLNLIWNDKFYVAEYLQMDFNGSNIYQVLEGIGHIPIFFFEGGGAYATPKWIFVAISTPYP